MLDNIKLGQYLRGDSWYYRLDPRNKLIITTFFIVIIFLANNWISYGIVTLFTLMIVLTSGIALKHFYRSIRPVMILMLFTFIINIFFISGEEKLIDLPIIRVFEDARLFYVVTLALAVGILIVFILANLLKKVSVSVVWRAFKYILLLTLITNYALMFYFKDQGVLLINWEVPIYEEALRNGGFIILRLILIICFSSLLTFTTKPTELTLGIEKVLAPLKLLKVQVSELALMISIALRFIPTLLEETQKILKAQTSRGADFSEGNVKDKIVQIISLLIPMFIISFKRAEDLANAMEARGYVPGQRRTSLRKLRWGILDTLFMGSFALLLGFIIYFRQG